MRTLPERFSITLNDLLARFTQGAGVKTLAERELRVGDSSHVTTIAKGGGIFLGGLAIGKGLGLGLQVILARFLGVEGYGLYALIVSIVQILDAFSDLGFRQGIVRFGAMYKVRGDAGRLKGLLLGAAGITLCFSIILSILVFLTSGLIAQWLSEPRVESLLGIAVWILMPSTLARIAGAFVRSQLRVDLEVRLDNLLTPLATLLLTLLFVGLHGSDVLGAVCAWQLALWATAGFAIYQTIRLFPQLISSLKPHYEVGEWLRFSIPTLMLATTFLLMRQGIRLMLGYFGHAESVGTFSAAAGLSENLSIFMQSLAPVFMPLVAGFSVRGDNRSLETTFRIVTRWALTLTMPLLLVAWLFGRELLLLFGEDFEAAYGVLAILTAGQLINVSTGPAGRVLQMAGKQDIDFLNGVAVMLLNLVLGLVWIPDYGTVGGALAVMVSMAMMHVARSVEVYYFLRIMPYDRRLVKPVFSALLAFALGFLFRQLANLVSGFLVLAAGVGVILASYSTMLLVLGLDEEDLQVIRIIAHKIGIRTANGHTRLG